MSHLLRFLLVGGLATALQFVLMVALVQCFGFFPVAASVVGYVVSALVNYQLNRLFTFASRIPHGTALIRFSIVSGLGLLINAVVMAALVDILRMHYVLAQVVTTAIVLVWNFGLSKRWTFADAR